jgi:DNA-binding CsgD family transcriptional regulator
MMGDRLPLSGGMVERDVEAARVRAVLDHVPAGRGRMVLVEGQPGLGKSMLLAAAGNYASEVGLVRLVATGSEFERTFAFGVIVQLLDPWVRQAPDPDLAGLFTGPAERVRSLFDPSGRQPEDWTAEEFAVLHGLYWLFAGLAERSPLLVVVDDVQWADSPSLRALAFLSRRLEGSPIGMLLATRPDAPADAQTLFAQHATGMHEVISLVPLTQSGVASFLNDRFPGTDTAVAEVCHRLTGGNPFYLQALCDEVSRSGASSLTVADVEQAVPRQVSLALRRRLDNLPDAAAAVARAVAVLGDGASCSEAAVLMGLDPDVAARAVFDLTAAGVLRGDDPLAFVHPIVRSAVEADMDPHERARLHAQAAVQRAERGTTPERIALHLLRTTPGAVPDAARTLQAAARRALHTGAAGIAATHLRRALQEPLERDERSLVSAALGSAAARAGLPQADADLRSALAVATTPEQRVASGVELARLLVAQGRGDEAIAALASAATGRDELQENLRVRVQAEMLAVGDLDLSCRTRAITAAQELGPLNLASADSDVVAMLLAHEAIGAIADCAPAPQAADLATRALAGGALLAAGVAGMQLSFLAATVLMCADRFDEAEALLDQAIVSARQSGSATGYAAASAWRSMVAYRRGELRTAEAHGRAGLDTARGVGLEIVEATAMLSLCWTLVDRDAAQDAASELENLTFDLHGVEDFQRATCLEGRGRVRLALGQQHAGVHDLLEAGRRIASYGLDNPACFPWRSGAVQALSTQGERQEAVALAHEEVALARRWGAPRALGIALRTQAALHKTGPAIELLEEASTVLEESPAMLERARVSIELGAALRRHGHQVEARQHLRRGLELAHQCGAPAAVAQARQELRAAGGRPRTPERTGIDALSPSEHRIAAIAAAGRTNPQIAQDLFVTVKTVEMHLSATYRKLGVNTRADLHHFFPDTAASTRTDRTLRDQL